MAERGRGITALNTITHKRSLQQLLKAIVESPWERDETLDIKNTLNYLADVENEADATGRKVEPSVRSFLRRLYEDNLDEVLSNKKTGGQIKKKRKRSKKKPRGWGKARYGNK